MAAAARETKFDVVAVQKAFANCLVDDNDVNMDDYILGYKEICLFFDLLGSVFGFVADDVNAKVKIIEGLRNGPDKNKFVTVKTMMVYETETELIKKSGYVSGSRTLLRLHRGLDFLRQFLHRMSLLESKAKTAPCCQEVYNETLAKFHPWLIKKGAVMAMYALPTKNILLEKMCGGEADIKAAMKLLPTMLDVTAQAYNRTNKLYEDFKLHELP